ncbi:hypothetical protein D9M71_614770 [compost metagenome]
MPAMVYGAPAAARAPLPPGRMVPIMPSRTACRLPGLGLTGLLVPAGVGTQSASKLARCCITRCGVRSWPSAMPPTPCTSCSGVTFQSPWPMLTLTVSPGYQRSLRALYLFCGEGKMPPISPVRSMPVGSPKP